MTYDSQVDCSYIQIAPSISEGEAIRQESIVPDGMESEVILDFNEEGHLLGVEIIGAARVLPPALLKRVRS